jgi:hypothetical protein
MKLPSEFANEIARLMRDPDARRGGHGHYDPNQPRVPSGNPKGGQWTDKGGGGVQPVMSSEEINQEIARLMRDPDALRHERDGMPVFGRRAPTGRPEDGQRTNTGRSAENSALTERLELAQAQKQPGLSPIEIARICTLDPAKVAADFANTFMPGVGRVDPITGQVRTLDWVKRQAYEMEQTVRKIQEQLCRIR